MLRFEVRPVILDMFEIQRADHFLALSRSVLSLDMLEIQKWDHFLCYVLMSALSLDMLEIQRADHSLCIIFRTTDGGSFQILRFNIHAF